MNTNLEWSSKDGLKMFGQMWKPSNTKAVICLVHGMGEHCNRYEHMANFFNDNDIAVLAYDQRGHGKSGGKRGHTPSYAMLMFDIDKLLAERKIHLPETPTFLYGHSFGGNMVSNYILANQPKIKGAIITGALLKLGFEPPKYKVALGKMMSGIYGAFTERSKLNANDLSHNKTVVQNYKEDVLVHDYVSARMFVDMMDAGNWAIENAPKLSVPALVMHGADDKITSPEGSKAFVAKAGSLATLKIWDNLLHEIHNEVEQNKIFNYTLKWIESQL